MLIHSLSWLVILSGLFFSITAVVGLFRLPDFYTRVHAAGMADTSSAALILLGLMLNAGFTLVTVKLIIILFLLLYTSPIATHSLVNAARQSGLTPILNSEDKDNRNTD